MNVGFSKRASGSHSDNPKSVGIVVLLFTFAMCGVEVRAQQPKKVPRIGYLSAFDAATESARSEAIRLAAMWMSSH
jgi:hypothetical protein